MRIRVVLAAFLFVGCGVGSQRKPTTIPPTTLMVAGPVIPPLPISYVPDYDIGEPAHVAAPRANRSLSRPRPTKPSIAPQPVKPQSGLNWEALRQCESHGRYETNTGNGYYGAYQFSARTWHSLGYPGLPHEASPATQDEAAVRLLARSGRRQWPVCSRRL